MSTPDLNPPTPEVGRNLKQIDYGHTLRTAMTQLFNDFGGETLIGYDDMTPEVLNSNPMIVGSVLSFIFDANGDGSSPEAIEGNFYDCASLLYEGLRAGNTINDPSSTFQSIQELGRYGIWYTETIDPTSPLVFQERTTVVELAPTTLFITDPRLEENHIYHIESSGTITADLPQVSTSAFGARVTIYNPNNSLIVFNGGISTSVNFVQSVSTTASVIELINGREDTGSTFVNFVVTTSN